MPAKSNEIKESKQDSQRLAGFRQDRHGNLPLKMHSVEFISAQGTRF